MLTIRQLQKINSIEKNENITNYYKVISIDAIVNGNTFAISEKKTYSECQKTCEKVKTYIQTLSDAPFSKYIKTKNGWYLMETDFNKLSAGQLIELLEYDLSDADATIENMAKVLSTLSRKCKFGKFFPEKYNADNYKKRVGYFEEVDIRVAFGYTNFFLIFTEILSQTLENALEKEMNTITDRE